MGVNLRPGMDDQAHSFDLSDLTIAVVRVRLNASPSGGKSAISPELA